MQGKWLEKVKELDAKKLLLSKQIAQLEADAQTKKKVGLRNSMAY